MNKKLLILLIIGLFLYGCGYKANPIYVSNKHVKVTKTPENSHKAYK